MPGPPPKPASVRQRRNKSSSRSLLPSEADSAANDIPELPPREDAEPWPLKTSPESYLKRWPDGPKAVLAQRVIAAAWHPKVLEWWDGIWRSPMASEFLDADMRGGLYLLAELYQLRWTATSRTALIDAAKEIRLQEVRFGLSPVDRRRLQWEVEKGEAAVEKTKSRRERKSSSKPEKDPRISLVS